MSPRYNLYRQKHLPKYLPLSLCTPPFCDVLPKGNHDSSEGGAGGKEPLATAKFAHKATSSLSTSNELSMRRLNDENRWWRIHGSSEVHKIISCRGTLDASLVEDSTRGRLKLAFN